MRKDSRQQYKNWALEAVKKWDGRDTSQLIIAILHATGEDLDYLIEDLKSKKTFKTLITPDDDILDTKPEHKSYSCYRG